MTTYSFRLDLDDAIRYGGYRTHTYDDGHTIGWFDLGSTKLERADKPTSVYSGELGLTIGDPAKARKVAALLLRFADDLEAATDQARQDLDAEQYAAENPDVHLAGERAWDDRHGFLEL